MTPAGHECWSFDDQRLFDDYAREVAGTVLATGERILIVPGRSSGLSAATLPVGDGVLLLSCEEAYAGRESLDPVSQVATYAAATEEALAAGFTGLQVFADATELVGSDRQRDLFARYEYLIGRYMRTAPMRAVCAYDRGVLGEVAVAELACLHESSHGAAVAFQLHPGATSAEAVLDGEVDVTAEQLFATALRRTDLASAGGEVVVDAAGLRFIDHQSLLAVQRYAESQRLTAVLRTHSDAVPRLAQFLDLPHVRVEVTR